MSQYTKKVKTVWLSLKYILKIQKDWTYKESQKSNIQKKKDKLE